MGLFNKILGGAPAEQTFWAWFAANSRQLQAVQTGAEPICDKLLKEMHRVSKTITFTFGPTEGGRREFIVSADGIKTAFPAVRKLVVAAPDLPDWKIIAFRPPAELGDQDAIRAGNTELRATDVWFSAETLGSLVHLVLFIKGVTEENFKVMTQCAFLLLDHSLGEYDVETKIGSIRFTTLTTDPIPASLKPLSELRAIIQQLPSP